MQLRLTVVNALTPTLQPHVGANISQKVANAASLDGIVNALTPTLQFHVGANISQKVANAAPLDGS